MRRAAPIACLFIASLPASAQERSTYTYDARGRLVRTEQTGVGDGTTTSYRLDPADNRSNKAVVVVADSSFETPEVGSGFQYSPVAAGTAFFSAGISGNGSAWGFSNAPDGDQVAFVQSGGGGGGGFVQLNVTGLVTGASYKVTFFVAQRPGFGINPVTVSFNGSSLGVFTPTSAIFTRMTASFVPTGSTGVLTFQGAQLIPDSGSAIDKIVVMTADSPP